MVHFKQAARSVAGSFVIVGTFASSGCFLRTQVIYPTPSDTISGFYATQPQSVSYEAVLTSGAFTETGSTSAIPTYAASVFTNPVAIQISATGTSPPGYLYPAADQTLAQPFNGFTQSANSTFTAFNGVSNNGTLSYYSDAWGSDSSCQLITVFSISGTLKALGGTPPTTSVSVNGVTTPVSLTGRVTATAMTSLLIQNLTAGSSSCATALNHISDCYSNAANCNATGGSLADNQTIQAHYQAIFGPWVDDAQVISAAEIATLVPDVNASLSSTIQYQ